MTLIPNSNTVVSYAYTVMAGGKKIGTLQGFNPSANRPLERVREIMNEAKDIVEIVPGRTEFTITIDRLETYEDSIADALGSPGFEDLSQIQNPFTIVETITSYAGVKRVIEYQRCWITSWNKTIREGTITVAEQVTVWPEIIVRSEG